MNKIDGLRNEIDKIDDELISLFAKRMDICREIGIEKAKEGKKVSVKSREEEVVKRQTEKYPSIMKQYIIDLYKTLFKLSKDYQKKVK